MKIAKPKINKIEIGLLALCCALAFPFMYSDFVEYQALNGLFKTFIFVGFTFLNPVVLAIVIVYFFTPIFLKNKRFFVFILYCLVLLVADAFLCKYVAMLLCGCWLPITLNTIVKAMQYQVIVAAPMAMILIIKQFIETQNHLLLAEKEKKEAELKLLKQQIDPHFLFNNLNILGALIQQDKGIAGEYLKKFASLYRYIISHKDEDVVLLDDEWTFAKNYVYLLEQRFGKAYRFNLLDLSNQNHQLLFTRFVPPGAIQTLIENITKHNQSEEEKPLAITIDFDDDYLTIKNEIRSKITPVVSTQTGLQNLQIRYALLSDKAMTINKLDGFFTVKIPLLKSI